MRTNNRGYVYVSSAFKDSLNVSLDNSVTAMIRFQGNDNADKNCERLRREIDFTEGQTFEIVPLEQANGGTIILAVIILAVFISFSGYLLIYNILYVSVVKDVQFYGRLKTIGMTQRQIKRIIYKQAIRISCIGIPIGLLLGAVVSFGIVPYFLNMMYSTNSDVGTKVSFFAVYFHRSGHIYVHYRYDCKHEARQNCRKCFTNSSTPIYSSQHKEQRQKL